MRDLEDVTVRSGHLLARMLHKALGDTSSACARMYAYNNLNEVDVIIEAMEEVVSLLRWTLKLKSRV